MKTYMKPVAETITFMAATQLMGASVTYRNQFGGTLTPEDGGKFIPMNIGETDGSDSPYLNGQGYNTNRSKGSLWDDDEEW
ncbi:MAG: hypothetical protein IJ604_08985 [Prevotella sp.]|nr:hypothetical protein [Prevotella sp.]